MARRTVRITVCIPAARWPSCPCRKSGGEGDFCPEGRCIFLLIITVNDRHIVSEDLLSMVDIEDAGSQAGLLSPFRSRDARCLCQFPRLSLLLISG